MACDPEPNAARENSHPHPGETRPKEHPTKIRSNVKSGGAGHHFLDDVA